MASNKACIYCGAENDLSESDIIPDALTNARIINRNVCRKEHNNKFSDLFESKVITSLAFITNGLDIKSSKGKNYAAYPAIVNIGGIDYKVSMTSEKGLFDGRVLKSADKKHLMSSYDKVLSIAQDSSKIQPLDINGLELEEKVNINLAIYFDEAVFRMAAKIAFEWYCSKNNVSGYHDDFKNIISYITTGKGINPVSIIQNKSLYDIVGEQANLGSHCLFGFEDSNGRINVVLYLFGIAMYRVIVVEHKPSFCCNNFLFVELCTDSSRKEITEISYEQAEKKFYSFLNPKNFIAGPKINGVTIMLPTSPASSDVILFPFVLNMMKCFDGIHEETIVPNTIINSILLNQIKQIKQASLVHKKSIKRFVNEYFRDGHEPIVINPMTSNKKVTFLLYILMAIGNSGIETIDDYKLQQVVKSALGIGSDSEITIDDALEKKLQAEMLETPHYSNIIEIGANIIKNWNN